MNLQILIALVIVVGMLWFLIGRNRPWFDWVFLLGSVVAVIGVIWLVAHYTNDSQVPESIGIRLARYAAIAVGASLAWASKKFSR